MNISNNFLQTAHLDYLDKLAEVEHFMQFIHFLENHRDIQANGKHSLDKSEKQFSIDKDLIHTIQSSAFLVMYNLIESTMTACIDAIYQTLQGLEIQHNQADLFIFRLHEKLQKHFLKQYSKYFSEKNISDIIEEQHNFIYNLLTKGYSKSEIFNGNIDVRKIKEVTKPFNVNIQPVQGNPFDTEHILKIKNKRNELAHGSISFVENSRLLIIGELEQLFQSTQSLLNGVFFSIDTYLNEQGYLKMTSQ